MSGRSLPLGALSLAGMGLAGLGISAYLTTVHYAQVPLLCTTGGVVDCAAVTSSTYSVVPGTTIPVTAPGMLWFAVSAVLAVLAVVAARRERDEPCWLRTVHVLWCVAGLAVVLYLVYAEISLRRICEWCTAVHLLVLASLLVTIARWQTAHALPRRGSTPG